MNWRGEYTINDQGHLAWASWFHLDSPEMVDAARFGMLRTIMVAAERGVKVGSA